jgi:hypothetical protein
MLGNEGKYAEAEQLQRETLEMERRILGADNLKTLSVEDNLADTLIYEKKDAEAEEILLRNFANVARLYGADHPELALINYGLGCIALHRGQRDEAISRIRTAVEHGFTPQQALLLESDPEMKPIQDDPRFVQIMAIAHQQANAGKNGKSTP